MWNQVNGTDGDTRLQLEYILKIYNRKSVKNWNHTTTNNCQLDVISYFLNIMKTKLSYEDHHCCKVYILLDFQIIMSVKYRPCIHLLWYMCATIREYLI